MSSSTPSFSLKQKHYAILNFAGVRVDPYDRTDAYQQTLRQRLVDGLYFFDNTLKYWVNNRGNDCFALYARTLSITGSDDPSSWKWYPDQGERPVGIEVAESVNLRWLEVRVRFSSVNLQQNTPYRVSVTVKATNWQMVGFPLNVRLILPNGTKHENPVQIEGPNRWEDLVVGTFQTSNNNVGVLDVALLQVDPSWKRGIAIKCISFVADE